LVAHLHFLPTQNQTQKNAKELPSQRTKDPANGQQSNDRKNASHNYGMKCGISSRTKSRLVLDGNLHYH
jgi:hypothetical protein